MGSGLSMTSVNKIKELANAKEYSLALDIVDTQDLTKSLNPQFLRLCAEIFVKNHRLEDARKSLILARKLGPESKRVILSCLDLYLRMGFFDLAKTYYDMYMFEIDEFGLEANQGRYLWMKHEGKDVKELEEYLEPFAQNLDYDWSFELFLLYKMQGKDREAKNLSDLYLASFKQGSNPDIISDIQDNKKTAEEYFNIFATEEQPDTEESSEMLRGEEQKLLEADELRMHPKEAEITIMYEEQIVDVDADKKAKKLLKKQEKEDKKAAHKSKKEDAESDSETGSDEESKDAQKSGLFKKLFKKKDADEPDSEVTETEVAETEEPESKDAQAAEVPMKVAAEEEAVEEPVGETVEETEESSGAAEQVNELDEKVEDAEMVEDTKVEEHIDTSNIPDAVIVVDDDDGFEAEADTVEELVATEAPKEPEKKKPAFVFQTVELAPEEFEDEFEVDDFSQADDDGFGEMADFEEDTFGSYREPETEKKNFEEALETFQVPDDSSEEEPEEEPVIEREIEFAVEEEPEVEPAVEPAVEEEPEVEPAVEEEPEIEPAVEEEPEVEPVVEAEPEVEQEIEPAVEEEPEIEPAVEQDIELAVEEEPEVETEIEFAVEEEPEVEPEIEQDIEFAVEEEPEVEQEIEPAVEEEPEIEPEIEPAVEEEPEVETEVEQEAEPKIEVAPFSTRPQKKKLDYPVFRSSLFPNYHKEVKEVENNFDDIVSEAQDKMSENMLKEEQMQKEAEALLASLGIDISDMKTSASSFAPKKAQTPKGPSRDEIKSSLKIDSVKKDILKKLKENR